jgi:hypothetical protein
MRVSAKSRLGVECKQHRSRRSGPNCVSKMLPMQLIIGSPPYTNEAPLKLFGVSVRIYCPTDRALMKPLTPQTLASWLAPRLARVWDVLQQNLSAAPSP